MNKKTTIIIIAVILIIIAAAVGGYLYLNNQKKSKTEVKAPQKAGEVTEAVIESTLKGVLPSLETNPLENKPDINPADKANPFKNIKINPF